MSLTKSRLQVAEPFAQKQKSQIFGTKEKSLASFAAYKNRPLPPPPLALDQGSAEPSRDVVAPRPSLAAFHVGDDKPSPLDFDAFLPWACKQMGLPEIVHITRLFQDKFVPISQRKKQAAKKKGAKGGSEILERGTRPSIDMKQSAKQIAVELDKSSEVLNADNVDYIPVLAYYDFRNRLVELAVTRCKIVQQLFIKTLSLCLPFHPSLTRMSITKCPLNQEILYEIGQLVPLSNFTEIIFDGTYVKQGNYYLVLDKGSQLKLLSLNRCTINDRVVKEICQRLDLGSDAGKTLQVLELSCNLITDVGASLLGNILKRNRVLLHINLAGNQITDDGATNILDRLKSFILTEEDMQDMRDRKRDYYKRKAHVYEFCYAEQLRQRQNLPSSRSGILTGKKKLPKPSPVKSGKGGKKSVYDVSEAAELMTDQIMGGPFKHLFDDEHITRTGDKIYCNGNLHFCSLNIAYNNVQFPTLKKLCEVLRYQNEIIKPIEGTGLIKVTLEGNLIPCNSHEFIEVDSYLKKGIIKTKDKSELLHSSSMRSRK